MSDFDLADPDNYRFWATDHVRFGDLDLIGHANNKAFAIYLETGRAAYLDEKGLRRNLTNRALALVRIEIDFLRELRYPTPVRIGVRPERVGQASLVLASSIFDGDHCAATSRATLVRFDLDQRKSTPFAAEERRTLEADL
jgi:acyl-CoA thioester hydrolase